MSLFHYLTLTWLMICWPTLSIAAEGQESAATDWCSRYGKLAPLAAVEVASGVFLIEGQLEEVFASSHGHVANVTFIVGETGVAVIDTGANVKVGCRIHRTIRQHTNLPIRYVINTHVHLDHIFGNAAFVSDTPIFIAHEKFPTALAAKGRHYQARLEAKWDAPQPIISPTRLVRRQKPMSPKQQNRAKSKKDDSGLDSVQPGPAAKRIKSIVLGKRVLQLEALEKGHTDHDLLVLDVKTNTLVAGDVLFDTHCPVIDGSLLGWRQILTNLRSRRVSIFIPGHGSARRTPQALENTDRYLARVETEVRVAVHKQLGMMKASLSLAQAESHRWKLCDIFHARNIISAYAELEWE
ncbi:MAG: MBL fold metallo-hydrolase [Myxococcales bacterium]|nr:MBL fold metallo-hydrolase [Myxococcales bacterium]